ncbi:sensor domain-containing diguanylate cyclase [Paracoccus gahaiensis]|uniref:diguanylate cyclase n=1 Tax=Paracoccus gahaiensis TaxID=1706839 RepID=A0A4U0R9Y4_9RHOB|nr:sensor domain-containing diguanylate cyclase [Paracoccus gahaiensis]TJZ92013.1 sensor domain-containing diguanylate cyclase [Paracoccus gahaiensis]
MYDDAKLEDEAGRVAALSRYHALDTAPETELSQIVGLARDVFQVSQASVNLIDRHRLWMMATAGAARAECRREDAFCDHTIRAAKPMAVPNLLEDERFRDSPFVQGEAHMRAYLGVPLTSPEGYNVGTLCLLHTAPRLFTATDADILVRFSELVVSQLEMRLIAQQDELTGTLTRRAFLQRLDGALASPDPFALVVLDLDMFKAINDTFGHPVGDIVLTSTARTIAGQVRSGDAFGRLGGEEFGLVLAGADSRDAMALAERIRAHVGAQVIAETGRPVTLSLGVAVRTPADDRTSLLLRADLALYEAKHDGRDRTVLARGVEATC